MATCMHCGGRPAECGCAAASGATTPARPRVARANQKRCQRCHADLTFAARIGTDDGRWLCKPCDARPADALDLDAIATLVGHAADDAPVPSVVADGSSAAEQTASPRGGRRVAVAAAIGVAVIGDILFAVFAPTWEDRHQSEIRSMIAAADAAAARQQTRGAYDGYENVLSYVAGQRIRSPVLADEVEAARQKRDALYPVVRAELARERAERDAIARAAEQERLAAEAAEAERTARAADEAARARDTAASRGEHRAFAPRQPSRR